MDGLFTEGEEREGCRMAAQTFQEQSVGCYRGRQTQYDVMRWQDLFFGNRNGGNAILPLSWRERMAKSGTKSAPTSMPAAGRNAKGGLTQKGRDFFAKRDGSHLKPGVTGAADTPEKMKRKGSFLVRTFTHPRGPMKDDKGQPTRLALSAHAWGERVPATEASAHKLAQKGHQLLEQYHRAMGEVPYTRKSAAKKTGTTNAVPAKRSTKKSAKKSARTAR